MEITVTGYLLCLLKTASESNTQNLVLCPSALKSLLDSVSKFILLKRKTALLFSSQLGQYVHCVLFFRTNKCLSSHPMTLIVQIQHRSSSHCGNWRGMFIYLSDKIWNIAKQKSLSSIFYYRQKNVLSRQLFPIWNERNSLWKWSGTVPVFTFFLLLILSKGIATHKTVKYSNT